MLADVARAHPTRVVWLEPSSEALAPLELLCGYDADLHADANRITNRLRGLLVAHWPALERAFGDRLDSRGVLAVLQQYPSGPAIKEAGIQLLTAALKAQRVRRPDILAKRLYDAALAQTVTITGSAMAARLIAELAAQLAVVLARRDELEKESAACAKDPPTFSRTLAESGQLSLTISCGLACPLGAGHHFGA